MPSADHMVLAAGGIAFASNFRDAGGFPSNGLTTIAATGALTFLASTMKDNPAVRAFAMLVLLVSIMYYAPGFYNKATRKHPNKGKGNG